MNVLGCVASWKPIEMLLHDGLVDPVNVPPADVLTALAELADVAGTAGLVGPHARGWIVWAEIEPDERPPIIVEPIRAALDAALHEPGATPAALRTARVEALRSLLDGAREIAAAHRTGGERYEREELYEERKRRGVAPSALAPDPIARELGEEEARSAGEGTAKWIGAIHDPRVVAGRDALGARGRRRTP